MTVTTNFDAQGATYTDDGTTITVPGLEPITYANFETVNVLGGTGAPGAAGLPCAAFVAVPFGMIALMWLLRRKP